MYVGVMKLIRLTSALFQVCFGRERGKRGRGTERESKRKFSLFAKYHVRSGECRDGLALALSEPTIQGRQRHTPETIKLLDLCEVVYDTRIIYYTFAAQSRA